MDISLFPPKIGEYDIQTLTITISNIRIYTYQNRAKEIELSLFGYIYAHIHIHIHILTLIHTYTSKMFKAWLIFEGTTCSKYEYLYAYAYAHNNIRQINNAYIYIHTYKGSHIHKTLQSIIFL